MQAGKHYAETKTVYDTSPCGQWQDESCAGSRTLHLHWPGINTGATPF